MINFGAFLRNQTMILGPSSNRELCRRGLLALAFGLLFALLTVAAQENPQAAIDLFNAGQDAHEKKDLKTAIEKYRLALAAFADFPEAEYQLGSALAEAGDRPAAVAAYRRAVALRPEWTLPLIGLAELLVQTGELEESLSIVGKIIEYDANSVPALILKAEIALRQNAPETELKALLLRLSEASGKPGTTAQLLTTKAALERRIGDGKQAWTTIQRALALEPGSRAASFESALIALANGDFAMAVERARFVNKQTGGTPSAKNLLARALAANGEIKEAQSILAELGPNDPEAQTLRAELAQNDATPLDVLEKSFQADPRNATTAGRLCAAWRIPNPVRALEFCRVAAELEPSNVNHVVGYGAALVQAKQFEPAIALLRKVVSLAPENFSARANLATAFFQIQKYGDAIAELEWMARSEPERAMTFYFLGICFDQTEYYLDAMAHYQLFLKKADAERHALEIDKVKLRLPVLQKQIKGGKGKTRRSAVEVDVKTR